MSTMITDIKNYILSQLLDDQNINIDSNTPLISSGLIDSISTLKLVDHLEKTYEVEFQPHEVDRDNLDNIELMAHFIQSKKQ